MAIKVSKSKGLEIGIGRVILAPKKRVEKLEAHFLDYTCFKVGKTMEAHKEIHYGLVSELFNSILGDRMK